MRRITHQSANPHYILETRQQLDRALQQDSPDSLDTDIAPGTETSEEYNELMDEFGSERVSLAYYYLHRYQLYKLGIFDIIGIDIEPDDLLAFLIIEEETACYEAQENAKLQRQAERTEH